jgi:hypothetical protein
VASQSVSGAGTQGTHGVLVGGTQGYSWGTGRCYPIALSARCTECGALIYSWWRVSIFIRNPTTCSSGETTIEKMISPMIVGVLSTKPIRRPAARGSASRARDRAARGCERASACMRTRERASVCVGASAAAGPRERECACVQCASARSQCCAGASRRRSLSLSAGGARARA